MSIDTRIDMCNVNVKTGYCERCGCTVPNASPYPDELDWVCIALEEDVRRTAWGDDWDQGDEESLVTDTRFNDEY